MVKYYNALSGCKKSCDTMYLFLTKFFKNKSNNTRVFINMGLVFNPVIPANTVL